MKTLELDQKAEDYLMLMQAAELLRDDRWVPHFSGTKTEMCILQALAAVKFPEEPHAYYSFTPPVELARLCRLRLINNGLSCPRAEFESALSVFFVYSYNDRVCKSGEEAATILEQAAELVLLREA